MKPAVRISGSGTCAVTIEGLTADQASILRDLIRALDGGISISLRDASGGREALLTCTRERARQISEVLSSNPHVTPSLAKRIKTVVDNFLRADFLVDCGGKQLDLGLRTHIMGILNVTPDSFSDGGRHAGRDRALFHARAMAAAGADIIDIGGESTRPGAEPVTEAEELDRIIPIIEQLSEVLTIPISVDTYKASVADQALEAGASIVNDISGLRFSPDMATVVAAHGAAVVIMHIQGTPRNMQQDPRYDDVVDDVRAYLEEGIELAVRAGVDQEQVLVDPGIGFGKNLDHNLTLLRRLDELKALGRPIVLGTSRKKFIGTVLGIPEPDQRVEGTAATVALGIRNGARIVRVHDVARMTLVARMTDAMLRRT